MDRLTIEELPDTKLVEGAKRWEEEKGEFVQIAYKEDIGHLALFQLREGFWRGSHYHEQKDETFYIVRGTMRAVFRDMDSGDQSEAILEKGLRVRVRPRLAHIFLVLTMPSL
jgi:mannose-6-phosphate isomerase-like protein (cupin superfamily)